MARGPTEDARLQIPGLHHFVWTRRILVADSCNCDKAAGNSGSPAREQNCKGWNAPAAGEGIRSTVA